MPKGIDPKAYAARVTELKKTLEVKPDVSGALKSVKPDPVTPLSDYEARLRANPKGTQAGHTVTDSSNHTRTVK